MPIYPLADTPEHITQLASLGRGLGHEFEAEVYTYDSYFAHSGKTLPRAPLWEVFAHVVRPEVIIQPLDLTGPPFEALAEAVPEVEAYPGSSSLERLLATYGTFVIDKHGGIFRPHVEKVSKFGRAVVFTANQYLAEPWDISEREPA